MKDYKNSNLKDIKEINALEWRIYKRWVLFGF